MNRDFLEEASLREGTMKAWMEKNPAEASGRVIVLYSLMTWSVRCCYKWKRSSSEKLRFIKLTSPKYTNNGTLPGATWERHQSGQEAEDGSKENTQAAALLGVSLGKARQGRGNSLGTG